MTQARLAILQNMPIFGGIRDDTLEWLLERAEIVSIAAGEFFFEENDPGGSLFVLETGHVVVLKHWDGHNYRLHEFGPGDCFGEMSMIDLCPRSASVLAVRDSLAIHLRGIQIVALLHRDLEQFALIQMNMAREISRRLREADEALFQERLEAKKIRRH